MNGYEETAQDRMQECVKYFSDDDHDVRPVRGTNEAPDPAAPDADGAGWWQSMGAAGVARAGSLHAG